MTLSRRHLIHALSAMTASLAFRRTALADDASATGSPRRVLFVYTPEGIWGGNSRWNQDWMVYNSQTSFTPVGMAAPLARHADNMVVFENLSTLYDNSQPQGGGSVHSGVETHVDGKAMILTNTDMVNFLYNSGKPQGQSLDVFLGDTIGNMYTPAWPNLQLGVATDNTASSTMTYLASGAPVISQNDPVAVYKALFSQSTLASVLSRRAAVLGQVNSDLTRFMARLSPALEMRASSAVDAVNTLQQRLTATANSCVNVPMPTTSSLNLLDGHNALTQSAAMIGLITAAFTCDLTRVISLVYQGVYSSVHGGLMGGTDNDIHAISHYSTPDGQSAAKLKIFEQIANLADGLKAIPEGTGTMLDNTLIVNVTEVNADHNLSGLPFATIGGKNLGVQVGNYLKLPTIATSGNGASSGFPIGCLLRSIIKAMGLPEQSFGNPKYSDQLIPGFLA